jgi:hypothetical protein
VTEKKWQASGDPERMLEFLADRASDRKLHLLNAACCRRLWGLIWDEGTRGAIEDVESYADRELTDDQFSRVRAWADAAEGDMHSENWHAEARADFRYTAEYCNISSLWFASRAVRQATSRSPRSPDPHRVLCHDTRPCHYWATAALSWAALARLLQPGPDGSRVFEYAAMKAAEESVDRFERGRQADIIRDLFGNPFRPVAIDPAWRSGPALALATAIYDERLYDRSPELADALASAGCSDAAILGHCRSRSDHVRGCWVVDAVLGNE